MALKTFTNTSQKQAAGQGAKLRYLTISGLMAAMITLMTAYICHIPTGINGGYIHFGDSIIYLAAAMLPTPYALAAAAIGGGLADLMTAPVWVPATVIIKMLLTLTFTDKPAKIITTRNIIASVIAYPVTGFGYFLAECILFDTRTALAASLSGNLVQSAGSAVFFVIFGLAFDKIHIKSSVLP